MWVTLTSKGFPWRPEEDNGLRRTGVTECLGAGNQGWDFWRCSQCCWAISPVSWLVEDQLEKASYLPDNAGQLPFLFHTCLFHVEASHSDCILNCSTWDRGRATSLSLRTGSSTQFQDSQDYRDRGCLKQERVEILLNSTLTLNVFLNFLKKKYISFFCLFVLFIYGFDCCLPVCLHDRRGYQIPLDGSESPYGCWELNLGPVEE